MIMHTSFTVVVLGGGVAGCAAALALCQHGIDDVLIVEAGAYDTLRIGESIPPDSRLLLEQLELWPDFLDEGHEPCFGSCSSWGDDGIGYNDFLFNPHGTGWHLDRRRFDAFLAKKAEQRGVELRINTRFIDAERVAEGGFELRLRSLHGPEAVRTQIVVDATGAHTRFARMVGTKKCLHDRLSWMSASFKLPASPPVSQLTMLEAVEYGWWYAARVPGECLVAGVATDAETLKQTPLHKREHWLSHLKQTRHMAGWLEACSFDEEAGLTSRTAPSFILDNSCGRDWLAVGDAASAYDPIASQGIYKALLDGLQAASMIASHMAGNLRSFDEYHTAIATRFTDYLKNRNYFYNLEQRWPAAPFWRRRQQRTTHLSKDTSLQP